MGVYYKAKVAWGLLLPPAKGVDLEDVYDFPAGMLYSTGGDEMNGEDIAHVLHPVGADLTILDTIGYREDGFGVHPVDSIYVPDDRDYAILAGFAERYNLDTHIGWFGISSVG